MQKLYVFETINANGTRVVGRAGLPHADMVALKTFYHQLVTRIVPSDVGTSRLKIKTPMTHKKNNKKRYLHYKCSFNFLGRDCVFSRKVSTIKSTLMRISPLL